MAIYELSPESIIKIKETTFAQAGLDERKDLQYLLKNQIGQLAQFALE